MRNGTTPIDGATLTTPNAQVNDNIIYAGSTIATLSTGDSINIVLLSDATPAGTINDASLIVKKLD